MKLPPSPAGFAWLVRFLPLTIAAAIIAAAAGPLPSRADGGGPMSLFKPAPGAPKAPRAIVQYTLRLTRTDLPDSPPAETVGLAAPMPIVLANPILKTLDGETASISVASLDLAYTFALSPGLQKTGDIVETLWTLRLAGKSLPGGAKSVTITGASRMPIGQPGVVAEITLSDPATKSHSVFRLEGVATTEAAPSVPVSAPTPAPRPEPAAAKRSK